MIYLERTKLQDVLSKALVQVINERVGERLGAGASTQAAVQRMIEILRPHAPEAAPIAKPAAPAATAAAASPDEVMQRKKLEQRNKDLEVRQNELWAENQRLKAAMEETKAEVDQLQKQNERLLKRIEKVKEEGEDLRAKVNQLSRGGGGGKGGAGGGGGGAASSAKAAASSAAASSTSPASTAAPAAAALTPELLSLLDRVFEALLDKRGEGKTTSVRVLALVRTLEHGKEAGQEKAAMASLCGLLRQIASDHKQLTFSSWHASLATGDFEGGAPSASQQATIVTLLSKVLDVKSSADGMSDAINKQEEEMTGMRGFHDMMANLASKLLIPPSASSSASSSSSSTTPIRHIHKSRVEKLVQVLTEPLDQGWLEEDKTEEHAMRALLRELKRMAGQASVWSLDEWETLKPTPGSFTPQEQDLFLRQINVVLGDSNGCENIAAALEQVGIEQAQAATRKANGK